MRCLREVQKVSRHIGGGSSTAESRSPALIHIGEIERKSDFDKSNVALNTTGASAWVSERAVRELSLQQLLGETAAGILAQYLPLDPTLPATPEKVPIPGK